MQQQVFFIGTPDEVAHHAAPLSQHIDYEILAPEEHHRILPGSLAVFFSEHFDRFRSAITSLRERNVATLYMIDGILEWRNAWENRPDEPACPFTMRPVLSDKVACIGVSQARTLAAWGNESKVEVVGVPRFDGLTQLARPTTESGKQILVMTAKCPWFTTSQRELVIQSLRDLKKQFAELGIDAIWRLTADLENEIGVESRCSEFTGRELTKILNEVCAVITTPSTAQLEAMLMDRPVAILDYTNSPTYNQVAWSITGPSQIKKTCLELMNPAESRIVLQRQFLSESLHVETSATDRMKMLIERMLEITAAAVSENRKPNFSESLLPCPDWASAKRVGFNHQAIFAHAEFQENDSVELQAQLSHSRREIDLLNKEIKQLKSELGQAHEIFEEIHRHPVAGPIVRARQWLLDWFQKPSAKRSPSKTEAANP